MAAVAYPGFFQGGVQKFPCWHCWKEKSRNSQNRRQLVVAQLPKKLISYKIKKKLIKIPFSINIHLQGGGGCLNTPKYQFFDQRGVLNTPNTPPRYAYASIFERSTLNDNMQI